MRNVERTYGDNKVPLKTEAVCLRISPFSETSAVATLFTRDFGKVQAIAKGLRRPRSRLEGGLDLFSQYELLFLPKKETGLAILTECTLIRRFSGLAKDLSRFYAASFATELVGVFLAESDPQPAILRLLIETFKRLETASDSGAVALAFATKTLRLLGFLPDPESCGRCSRTIEPREKTFYSLKEKDFICARCKGKKVEEVLSLSGGTRAFLRGFVDKPLSSVARMRLSHNARKEIASVIKSITESSAERKLKSIDMALAKVGGKSAAPSE